MEQHLGRKLESSELVHHKGIRHPLGSIENKQDNELDNLVLTTRYVHPKNHPNTNTRPLVWNKLSCLVCGKLANAGRSLCKTHHTAWYRGWKTFPKHIQVPPSMRYKKNFSPVINNL